MTIKEDLIAARSLSAWRRRAVFSPNRFMNSHDVEHALADLEASHAKLGEDYDAALAALRTMTKFVRVLRAQDPLVFGAIRVPDGLKEAESLLEKSGAG